VSTRPVPKCAFQSGSRTHAGRSAVDDRFGQFHAAAAFGKCFGRPSVSTDKKCRGCTSPRLYGFPRMLTGKSSGFSASQTPWMNGYFGGSTPCGPLQCQRASLRSAPVFSTSTASQAPTPEHQEPSTDTAEIRIGSFPVNSVKDVVQRFIRSTGIAFNSRPQPGQKSSLVTKSLGLNLARFLLRPVTT